MFLGPRIATAREPDPRADPARFSTASSEAAYPKTLEQLERFGVSKRITSFVLPLGYSFNLDGSMMYCTFAMMFIAQAYGIELDRSADHDAADPDGHEQGHGGRAARVAGGHRRDARDVQHSGGRAAADQGIDQFLDMGRSATNVVGNSIATAVVANWEGELRPEARRRRRSTADEGIAAARA